MVCTIKSNQTVDVFIKYFAYYHTLYSGQLEIRLSVLILRGICLNIRNVLEHVWKVYFGWTFIFFFNLQRRLSNTLNKSQGPVPTYLHQQHYSHTHTGPPTARGHLWTAPRVADRSSLKNNPARIVNGIGTFLTKSKD